MRAHRGMDAVGADQQFAVRLADRLAAAAIDEVRAHAVFVVSHPAR